MYRTIPGNLLLVLLLFLSVNVRAGGSRRAAADSTEMLILKNVDAPDTLITRWYFELCQYYQSFDAEKSLAYGDSVIAYGNRMGDPMWEGRGHIARGIALRRLNRYGEGITAFDLAADRFLAGRDTVELVAALLNKSTIYTDLHIFPESQKCKQAALELSRAAGHTLGEGMCLRGIGLLYVYQEAWEQALEYCLEARAIFASLGQEGRIALTNMHLGSIYLGLEDREAALKHHRLSEAHFEKTGDARNLSQVVYLIGQVFEKQGERDSSRKMWMRSYAIAEKVNSSFGMLTVLGDLTGLALEEGNLEMAKELRQRFDGLLASMQVIPIQLKGKVARVEARLSAAEGDYATAYARQEAYIAYNDSMVKARKDNGTRALLEALDVKEKAQKIELLTKRSEVRRLQFWMLMAGSLVILLLAVWLINRQRLRLRNKNLLLENEQQAAELAAERMQRAELEKQQLGATLEVKESEITDMAIQLTMSHDSMGRIRDLIRSGKNGQLDPEAQAALNGELDQVFRMDQQRQYLEMMIERQYRDFLQRIADRFPELSQKDLRLASMLRLGLSSKEIASIQNIASNSVDTYRHRLRKKFGLEKQESITEFLQGI